MYYKKRNNGMRTGIYNWKLLLSVNLMLIISIAGGMNFKYLRKGLPGAAQGTLTTIPAGFRLSMKKTPGSKGFVEAYAAVKQAIKPDQALYFKWRGGANNQNTTFGIFLSVFNKKTKKNEFKIRSLGSADGTQWKVAILRFDKYFGIKNDSYETNNLRLVLTGKNNPNADSSIEIVELAILEKAEAKQKAAAFKAASATASPEGEAIKFARGSFPGSAKGTFENIPGGFRLTMEKTPGSKGLIDAKTVNFRKIITPKQRLQFRFRGAQDNSLTTFGVMFSFKDSKTQKSIFKAYRVGSADGSEWRKATIAFDQNLKLSADAYEITLMRFVLTGKDSPKASSSVEVIDVEIVDQNDLSLAQSDFLVVPAKKKEKKIKTPAPAGFKAVKVFFDFDNNDFKRLLTRRNQKPVYEKTASAGFRDLVLKNCEGIIKRVDSPEKADVIVYSRAIRGPNGPAIVKAVKRGAGLLVYGVVPDPELLPLLPAEIDVKTLDGLAERKTVMQSNLPLFGGEKFNDVDFGIYMDLISRSGAKNVLTYADGKPLAVEKGKVLQYGVGIGTTLLRSDVFYDKLLVNCMLWYGSPNSADAIKALKEYEKAVADRLDKKERGFVGSVTDAAGISKAESKKFFRGMSYNNFGRFGYRVAEGLACDNMDFSLKVVDAVRGVQGYTFDVVGRKSVPLKRWQVKKLSGNVEFPRPNVTELDSKEIWRGLGKVEYRCQLEMKPEWKGKSLFLEVKDGISDCDETWFNGQRIGGVSKNVTQYWLRRRRYVIPEKLVKWGKVNEFRVVIENLHHGACFNSRPELIVADFNSTRKLSVTDINWIYKQYEITSPSGVHRMSFNQVTPFILYNFSQKNVAMATENIAEYAAFATAKGIKLVNLIKNDTLYDFKRDGRLAAPWILLYRSEKTLPLMLALSRNISSIKVEASRGDVERIIFDGGAKPLGEIVVGRPWGITRVDTFNWGKNLPTEVEKRITASLNYAFNLPVACDEVYRVDWDKKQVEIVDRFRFHRVKDEWNTTIAPYAILPPVTAFSIQNKILGSSPDKLIDFGMNTKFGPLLGVKGRDTVRYTLPLPDRIDPFLPQIASSGDKLVKDIQEYTVDGCKWTFGGRKTDFFTSAEPAGAGFPTSNIDPFGWQMDMGPLLEGYFQYGEEAKHAADERIKKRVLEPMELYRYKNFYSARVEPFSGIEYTVNFGSTSPNLVNYAPGFGSKLIFIDSNEVYAQTAWIAAMMADRLGYARQIRNAWPHYKYLASYNLVIDDWAFHSGSCREHGIGGWADMLNCEFPAMFYHARLAEIAGDQRSADDAIYRAAKKMVPTIARLRFEKYMYANKLVPAGRKVAQVFGFNETEGGKFFLAPLKLDRFILNAVDLLDFSRGFSGSMSHLMKQYSMPQIQKYIKEQALPALIDKDGKFISSINGKFGSMRYLVVLAQFCDNKSIPLEKYANEAVNALDKRLRGDRAGFQTGYELGNVLAWKYKVPYLQTAYDTAFNKCSYNVKTRRLTLEFIGSSANSIIVIPEPKSISSKGKNIAKSTWKMVNGGVSLPIRDGKNDFIAQY
jgi:hypothetical protein